MKKEKSYFIGVDIGSISVDVVLIDEACNILYAYYVRSHGKPFETLLDILKELNAKFNLDRVSDIGFTGSGGKTAAGVLEVQFFNEILTQSKSVQRLYPKVRSIIDMGGEDSKFILLAKDENSNIYIKDFAMNTICAAGTGSFLDQQATRVGFTIEDFGQIALKSKNPPRIAGRCSVFAKTDMIHLQQEGTRDYDIISGLCFALARNFKSNIAKGKEFVKPVSFQGGVAANRGMVRAFGEVLNLPEDELIIPEHHGCMGAIGAALLAKKHMSDKWKFLGIETIENELLNLKGVIKRQEPLNQPQGIISGCKDLLFDKDKLKDKKQIDAFLGIDVGSISTNVVVIDEHGRLIAKQYLMTAGRPLEAIKMGLKGIYLDVKDKVKIIGAGTTGSGRYLIGDFIGADVIRNEITTQATAASFIDKKVDTIFEIGGQDSKYISLHNGTVVDFRMNNVCAAGTGSFLEEQAERLNINIKAEFGERALGAKSPCALGERCTVFMESNLIHYQQQGANLDDLVAGLSYSIVYNYLNRVVEDRKVGENIFFQGGVAFNKAVVAAFEKVTGKKITVPPHHEVTGAIGVALLAKKETPEKTRFKGFKEIIESSYGLNSFDCQDCPNHCEVKVVQLESGNKLYYGSRCGKYSVKRGQKINKNLPDLFKEREEFLLEDYKKYNQLIKVKKAKRVGIPRSMIFHELLPLWTTFFGELGFKVILSDTTNKEIIHEGIQQVKAEPCFPIKAAHGHINNLLKKGVDCIFLPTIINMPSYDASFKQSFSCPYVQSLPYMIEAAIDFKKLRAQLLKPEIILGWNSKVRDKTMLNFARSLGFGKVEAKKAIKKSLEAQKKFYDKLQHRGREILSNLEGKEAAVIISRPYNGCDRGINLNLPHKLRQLGVLPIPMDYLPLDSAAIDEEWSHMYWRYGQKILKAAQIISCNENLIPIYLSNFGCGPDSFIMKFFSHKMKGKPHLYIEIDEHSVDVGIITRCEAFLDSIRSQSKDVMKAQSARLNFNPGRLDKNVKVYIPRMGDHALIAEAVFRANGFDAEIFPESNSETLYWGRKFTSGKECYPCILTTGDMVRITKRDTFKPESSAFFMPTTEGPCRFGQYRNLQRIVLEDLGLKNVPIISFNQAENLKEEMGKTAPRMFKQAWEGIVAMDLLRKLLHSYRPYEENKQETDKIYRESRDLLYQSIINHSSIVKCLRVIKEKFMNIKAHKRYSKPLIGIVGEIYVRNTPFSNEDLVRNIENLGGEVWLAPISEWLFHINKTTALTAQQRGKYFDYLKVLFVEKLQRRYEHKLFSELEEILDKRKEPPVDEIWNNTSGYLPSWFGEAALGVGKSIDFYKRQAAGIVSVMPFTCLPGNIFASVLPRLRKDCENIPAIVLAYDGLGTGNIETRLEAFMYQAKERWKGMNGNVRSETSDIQRKINLRLKPKPCQPLCANRNEEVIL